MEKLDILEIYSCLVLFFMNLHTDVMNSDTDLQKELRRIDGRGYKAYKDIAGGYDFGGFLLFIDHVQGDPFAAPSKLRIKIAWKEAGFPRWSIQSESRRTAFRDYLTREFSRAAYDLSKGRRGSGKGGRISIDTPGQEVLERTSVMLLEKGEERWIEVRFFLGLPAFGRKIAGREAEAMLFKELPEIVKKALYVHTNELSKLQTHVEVNEDAHTLRTLLDEYNLVAFVAEGAVLPRRSGIDDRPMVQDQAVPFCSPESLRSTLTLPNRGEISGMGVPQGVTLIVGGGYHGKSTLLKAMERGIYNHIPGDGREFVVSLGTSFKVRAEDGRSIVKTSITPFISGLPGGRDTEAFSSEDASGSTSQAANIIEALEVGARVLLVDEDTSATNFMIRDHRMQELISPEREPITPFIDKVRQLSADLAVSTILVIGGSGDYFDVADRVIAMNEYVPEDVTRRARSIAEKYRAERKQEGGESFGPYRCRAPIPESLDPTRGKRDRKLKSHGVRELEFGTSSIDLSLVEQLVDQSQTRTIGEVLLRIRSLADGKKTIKDLLEEIYRKRGEEFFRELCSRVPGDLAYVRGIEVACALNRLRGLKVNQH